VPALPVVPDTHEDDEAVGDDDIDDLDGDGDEDADEDDDDEDTVTMSASAAAAAARTPVDPTASAAAAASKALRAAARLVRGTKIHFTRAHIRDVVVASAHALGYRRVRPFRGSASAVVPDIVWVGAC
jgi:hypothetical protein